MQAVEVLWRAQPVKLQVGFIPDLEIPALYFGMAVPLDVVARPLVHELGPLEVVSRGVRPSGRTPLMVDTGSPLQAIGNIGGGGSHCLRHEADFEIRMDTACAIGVDDVIDYGEIIHRLAVPFGVDVGAAPLEVGCPVTGCHQVVSAEVNLARAQAAQFHQQPFPFVGCAVVGLVRSEETPDRLQLTDVVRGIHRYGHRQSSRGGRGHAEQNHGQEQRGKSPHAGAPVIPGRVAESISKLSWRCA